MNVNHSRIGLLFAPTTAYATKMTTVYDAETFVLGLIGGVPGVATGMVLADADGYVRIREHTSPGHSYINLAENAHSFPSGTEISIYNIRLPFPRYQRISSNGTTYKDYFVGWPGVDASLPPQVLVSVKNPVTGNYSEALWVAESTNFEATAVASRAIAASGDPLTFAWSWDAYTAIGTGDTLTIGSGSAGFRYVTCTATDQHGTTASRHVPCWIGSTPFENLTSCRLTWSVNRGWTLEAEVVMPPAYLQRSPVALVDLDTCDVLFYGFLDPTATEYDFEQQTLSFRALSALAAAGQIYSYPFILTSPTVAAENWQEINGLTLERALHFLLYWHSNLPEIANIAVGDPAARSIKGQEFSAGTLLTQLTTLADAAFWELRGYRGGGFAAAESPLYRAESSFLGYTGADLTDGDDIDGSIQIDLARPAVSEAQLSGVYRNGNSNDPWTAVIIAAPSHPGDLGNPVEVNNLAPITQAEIERWAARHVGLENVADTYTVKALIDIDPAVYQVADLPDGERIEIEDVRLNHDAKGLLWNLELSGRTYGNDVDTVVVPIPPEVVIPDPEIPEWEWAWPVFPPLVTGWPTTLYVGTINGGVFYTDTFAGPTGEQPTWVTANEGLAALDIYLLAVDPSNRAGRQYCICNTQTEIYRRTGGSWTLIMDDSDASTLVGHTISQFLVLDISPSGIIYAVAFADNGDANDGSYLLKSTNYGENWTSVGRIIEADLRVTALRAVTDDILWIGRTYGVATESTLCYSSDGGSSWIESDDLYSGYWVMIPNVSSLDPETAYIEAYFGGSWSSNWGKCAHSGSTITDELLQDNFGGYTVPRPDDTWISAADKQHQRRVLIDGDGNSRLFITHDGWQTLDNAAPDPITPPVASIVAPVIEDETKIILGAKVVSEAQPHHVLAMVGETSTAPVGLSNDIPYSAGGICLNGIQVIA